MKVAMLSPDRNYEKGISNYSKDLIDAIKKKGLDIDSVTYKNRKFISLLKVIPQLKKYDIIHIQHENRLFGFIDGFWFPLFITLIRIITKGKLVITFHTVHTKKEQLFSLYPFLNFFKKNFTHPLNYIFANFFAKLFIVHTSFLKDDLIKNSPIKENKVIVIPQGVKLDVPHFNKTVAKKKLKLKDKIYLMIGTMGPNKGFDFILKQAKRIGKNILIVGGLGSRLDYIANLQKYVTENNLQKIVKFDLRKEINSKSKIWWLYFSAADLVLLPYRVMATSGIFIDAMGAGKPVIGCCSEYFKEISKKYDCIKIAEKEQDYPKVIREAMKPQNYKKMIKECKKYAKENSIFRIGRIYKNLYKKIGRL